MRRKCTSIHQPSSNQGSVVLMTVSSFIWPPRHFRTRRIHPRHVGPISRTVLEPIIQNLNKSPPNSYALRWCYWDNKTIRSQICTHASKMIISHFNGHKQRVKISDEVSGLSTINRGVFNIFLSNLHLIQFSGKIANYADDNHLYNEIAVSVKNLKKTRHYEWC